MSPPPGDEYRARLASRQAAVGTLARRDRLLSHTRLLTFLVAAAFMVLWWRGAMPAWWLALPAILFAVLIHRHDRVIRAHAAAQRSILFYERGLARIEDRWAGTGEPGDRFQDEHHLYANDLDLFGRGSLFELLSLARTRAGEERLAEWLKQPASLDEVRARQDAVAELTPALDLREAVFLAGADVRAGVDSDALVIWAEGAPMLSARWLRGVAVAFTGGTIGAATYWAIVGDYAYLLAVLLLQAAFSIPQRRSVQQALHAAEAPARDLDVLAHVLGRLEREDFKTVGLAALRRQLDTSATVGSLCDPTSQRWLGGPRSRTAPGQGAGVPASAAIRRLHRLVELHDWQHNQFFAPVAAALLWGTHLAWAIERWRHLHGSQVRMWLGAVGDFEALSSLSAYRYEHPDDVWPEIVDMSGAQATFDGHDLGHPLVPASRMVRNDVRLSGDTCLLIVSGSNMSGKSTLLRTVGINAVLALAGAPVRAATLRMTPLAIGATLRIQDSLQEGRSRFFAEITRIRELADTARGPVPLLFLLDELFHGTNSHDRLVGASGILRSLLDRGAIGLITTHDLALNAIADDLAPRAATSHFEDHFEGGEIHFDYRMKPGPVMRSNAIALMRAVGLDVGSDVQR